LAQKRSCFYRLYGGGGSHVRTTLPAFREKYRELVFQDISKVLVSRVFGAVATRFRIPGSNWNREEQGISREFDSGESEAVNAAIRDPWTGRPEEEGTKTEDRRGEQLRDFGIAHRGFGGLFATNLSSEVASSIRGFAYP
jgi:hypothetical protein